MKTFSNMQLACIQKAFTLHVVNQMSVTATQKAITKSFPMLPGTSIKKAIQVAQALEGQAKRKEVIAQLQAQQGEPSNGLMIEGGQQ